MSTMVFILHAVTQQLSPPQQQPAGVQHQLLSSATGHQPQLGNLLIILLPMHVPMISNVGVLAIDDHHC